MDFFLQDPDEHRLPPESVRLRELQIAIHPQGNKVKVNLELSPFKVRPNLEVTIFDPSGKEVAHTNILDAVLKKMEFIMHLRTPIPGGEYRLVTAVYYQKLPEPSETQVDLPIPEPTIVDRREATFVLPLRDG
ncbi:MAG TPA: hypothetical protein VF831_12105 [Anaerolineales bacterium]